MSVHTYDLRYSTHNEYEPAVKGGHFIFTLMPCETDDQLVQNLKVDNSLGEKVSFLENAFGFTTLLLTTRAKFSSLKLDMTCQVRKTEENPYAFDYALSEADERSQLASLDFRVHHQLFLKPTRLTEIGDNEVEKDIPSLEAGTRIFEFLREINQALHQVIKFQAGVTHPGTTAREAWAAREGVCQDFSHIFIGLARNRGIPARYVSGYLHQGGAYQGASQMHAWVEAFVPGLGWKAFDPSNQLMANHHYIKVAHGVDYNDCSPIKGVMQASRSQESNYTVHVSTQQ